MFVTHFPVIIVGQILILVRYKRYGIWIGKLLSDYNRASHVLPSLFCFSLAGWCNKNLINSIGSIDYLIVKVRGAACVNKLTHVISPHTIHYPCLFI